MNASADPHELLRDNALLLATIEQLAKSMNGPRAQRLAMCLEAVALDASASLLDCEDAEWLSTGVSDAQHSGRVGHWRTELIRLEDDGVSVIPSASPEYPANLQLIHERPPVLFVRGDLQSYDERCVAIVGTREPSDEGIRIATLLSTELGAAGVTILSGLAKGIDAAAHAAVVNGGRRTVAVFGTPIDRIYPAENKALAEAIIRAGGAHVSQFLPGTNTSRWGFPVRNVTMSGLSLGTVVVEAGETSGARLQAEAAVAHGKRVFLLERLVTHRDWARQMAGSVNVTVARDADAILEEIERQLNPAIAAAFQ